jgi:hypothetical protein
LEAAFAQEAMSYREVAKETQQGALGRIAQALILQRNTKFSCLVQPEDEQEPHQQGIESTTRSKNDNRKCQSQNEQCSNSRDDVCLDLCNNP